MRGANTCRSRCASPSIPSPHPPYRHTSPSPSSYASGIDARETGVTLGPITLSMALSAVFARVGRVEARFAGWLWREPIAVRAAGCVALRTVVHLDDISAIVHLYAAALQHADDMIRLWPSTSAFGMRAQSGTCDKRTREAHGRGGVCVWASCSWH
jgi:hypothetical protein